MERAARGQHLVELVGRQIAVVDHETAEQELFRDAHRRREVDMAAAEIDLDAGVGLRVDDPQDAALPLLGQHLEDLAHRNRIQVARQRLAHGGEGAGLGDRRVRRARQRLVDRGAHAGGGARVRVRKRVPHRARLVRRTFADDM